MYIFYKAHSMKILDLLQERINFLLFSLGVNTLIHMCHLVKWMVDYSLIFLLGSLLTLTGAGICTYWYIFWKQNYHNDLITNGPYSFVRHPFYTGFMMIALGLTLSLPIYETKLLAIFTFAVMFVYVPKEEEQLLKQYQIKYKEYMKKVRWKFIPFFYWLNCVHSFFSKIRLT